MSFGLFYVVFVNLSHSLPLPLLLCLPLSLTHTFNLLFYLLIYTHTHTHTLLLCFSCTDSIMCIMYICYFYYIDTKIISSA